VRKYLFYSFFFIAACRALYGQPADSTYHLRFQDSLRAAFENTKGVEAIAVGNSFAEVWNNLTPTQQSSIQSQSVIMRKKGFRIKPHFVTYFKTLVTLSRMGNTDPTLLDNFLRVTKKVVLKEPIVRTNEYLVSCLLFFEEHLLASNKLLHVHALDDAFRLDYIDPPKPYNPETDTIPILAPEPDTTLASLPVYLQPIQQPEVNGPVLFFDQLSINVSTPYDSVFLTNTKGTLGLIDHLFVGEGGKMNWSSAGLGQDSVYYEFSKYNFNVNKPIIKAAQGKLTYVGKVEAPIPGIFEFKSVAHKEAKLSSYPKFASYVNDISFSLGSDKIEYKGGFALAGSKVGSGSVSGGWSQIRVKGDSSSKFSAWSKAFEFKDSTITAALSKFSIYMEGDSIYHPSISFNYNFGKERVTISRGRGDAKNTPFTSSFFNMDFNADEIRWDLKSDSLNIFHLGSGIASPLILESVDFYDPEDYRILKGQGFYFHPLALVANYATKVGSQDISVYDLAGKYPLEEIKMAMGFLAQKGMIEYDKDTGKIHVRDKAIHAVESAKGKADYDNIKIHSFSKKSANATINFSKNYMLVNGVEDFIVSDSLNVIIKPDSSRIKIFKNRDVEFDGKVNAGKFEIMGKNFKLRYDSFFINLKKIDSIRLYQSEKNGSRTRLKNTLVQSDSLSSGLKSGGKLFINLPNNKSAKVKQENYPRIESHGGEIHFGKYRVVKGKSEHSIQFGENKGLYFIAPPFRMDSLNYVDSKSLRFDGIFSSSGIFPDFKESLHTMQDKSLGFEHQVPASGFQLYNGEGKFKGKITINNDGLKGNGTIDYLASTIESDEFNFALDSVTARGKKGEIKNLKIGAVSFPQVTIPSFTMKCTPSKDSLVLKNQKEPFTFYNKIGELKGTLLVTKNGVLGKGTFNALGTESVSKEFRFSGKEFSANHTRFTVKSENPDKPALTSKDVKLDFSLDKNYADISPEVVGNAAIEFPFAQFKTSIPNAHWDLKTQKIQMSKAAEVAIEDSYFYTTRKDLDSLRFNAEKAEYDIKKQELKVSGIPYIIVADAKITPENNEVLILENAKIGQLKNTTIILDTLNSYHRLTNGVVDIISRKEFKGYATYQYVNVANDTFAIKMSDFKSEPISNEFQEQTAKLKSRKKTYKNNVGKQTVATGHVDASYTFHLAPKILYKGDLTMYATKPALQLKGFVKLDLKKIKGHDLWLSYESTGEVKDILIDFDKAVTEDGIKPDAGLHFADDNSLYISFISRKKSDEHDDFFIPSGSLFFDHEKNEFKIEDHEKAAGNKLSGRVFSYNEDTQEVRFEGPVNFFKSSNEFKLNATVIGNGNLETNDIKINSFLTTEMSLPPASFQLMATALQEVIKNEGLAEGLGDQTELLYKIANLVGEKAAKDYEQKSLQNYTPLATIPALVKPLVFSNVNLKWSQKQKAFFSEGTIGIANILKNDINGAFEGFMEIKKDEGGNPIFHAFIKASPEVWYYFGYEDNQLMVHSGDENFNQIIAKKTNGAKAKVGQLVFVPGSNEDALSFINRFRKTYYGVEVPYDLSSGTSAAKKSEKKKEEKTEDDGF
jgi:hypothetical protein